MAFAVAVVGLVSLSVWGCSKKKKTTPAARRTASGSGTGERPTAREGGSGTASRPGAERPGARESGTGTTSTPADRPAPRTTPGTTPAVRRPPPPRLMPISRINGLIKSGKYLQAVREAKKILEVKENSVPAMAAMAMAYFRKGDLELCRAVLASIQLQQKDNEHFLYLWGHLYLREGNYTLARKYFERAVAKNPRLLDAWLVIGVRYLSGGSYRKALSALLKAKALPGGDTYSVNLNLGSAYRGLAHRKNLTNYFPQSLRHYERAEALWRKAKGGTPYLKAIYNKAILFLDAQKYPGYTKIKRLEKGIAYMKQYVTLAPRLAGSVWAKEKKEVMKIYNKARNVDLPSAKAQAAAAQPARPQPRRAEPRRPPPR